MRSSSVFEKRVQKVESSEISQKWVKMPFLVLGSFHRHRLGQISRTVNVASPEKQGFTKMKTERGRSLEDCHVVGEQLKWDNAKNSLGKNSSGRCQVEIET